MQFDGRKRVVIQNVRPALDDFPVKRAAGERINVSADILCDGHDLLGALLLFRRQNEQSWSSSEMELVDNDRWEGSFVAAEIGAYFYTVQAWVDHFGTWLHNLGIKYNAEQDISVDLQIGAQHLI